MTNPSALIGAILFAWMPEEEHPHRPGPKFRPVLVVDADPSAKRICLAYGTSQRVEQNGKGEITLRKGEIQGLNRDTKFCLGKTQWVPLTAEYLCEGDTGGFSVLGLIPKAQARKFFYRLKEVSNR